MTQEIVIPALVTIILFFLIRLYDHKLGRIFYGGTDDREAYLRGQIEYLEAKQKESNAAFELAMAKLKAEYEEENKILRRYVDNLLEQVGNLRRQIEFSEHSEPALLLVCGEATFCEQDENSIRRAGIKYTRLSNASSTTFMEEMRRRRISGNPYDYVHISAHAGPKGILFGSENVSSYELSRILGNLSILFLAGCSDVKVADKLIGPVKAIISLREDTDSALIEEFSYQFWKEIKLGRDSKHAFTESLNALPERTGQIDLREVGK